MDEIAIIKFYSMLKGFGSAFTGTLAFIFFEGPTHFNIDNIVVLGLVWLVVGSITSLVFAKLAVARLMREDNREHF